MPAGCHSIFLGTIVRKRKDGKRVIVDKSNSDFGPLRKGLIMPLGLLKQSQMVGG